MFSEMTIQPIQYHWLIAMTATGLSTEVAWWLPSFYSHRFCGICDGQLADLLHICAIFLGKYFTQKIVCSVHFKCVFIFSIVFDGWGHIILPPNTKMLRICCWEACNNFLCSRISCAVHIEEICMTDFSF